MIPVPIVENVAPLMAEPRGAINAYTWVIDPAGDPRVQLVPRKAERALRSRDASTPTGVQPLKLQLNDPKTLPDGGAGVAGTGTLDRGTAEAVVAVTGDFGGGFLSAHGYRADGDYISNDWKENQNGEEYQERLRAGRPDLLTRAADLRARVKAVNREFADRYGWGEPSVRSSGARRSDESGNRRDRGVAPSAEPEARPSYGTAQQHSVSAVGVHFSPQPREALNGAYYGRGLDGAERARLDSVTDKRLKFRIHFYASTGQGVQPESGVGAYPHSVTLNNLYDFDADTQNLLFGRARNDQESAVRNGQKAATRVRNKLLKSATEAAKHVPN